MKLWEGSMNVQLTGLLSHPGKIISVDMGTCVNPVAKIRFRMFLFLVGSVTCCINPVCCLLAKKENRRLGAIKVDQQMPRVLKSPATTLEPGKAED